MSTTTEPGYLETLVAEYYQALYRFGFSLSGNATDAADLTQQTFYIAQLKIHQLRDAAKAKTWLFTTLMREFLQKRRHETRFPKFELDQVADELPKITADHVARMDSASVVAALQSLDDSFRVPLVLFYLEDMPYKEIAQTLELPIGTVMSRLARGKAQLRHELERFRNPSPAQKYLRKKIPATHDLETILMPVLS
ncbi:MAG: polymerase, sigma-24 subunit, subfamily [Pedosphaera sp.]|nr:polymerase, sigma-24 subunit, subfamily [Pedosphaera sp.]